MLELSALHAEIGRLGLRRLQLSLGLCDIGGRHDAGRIAVARELERRLIGGDRRVEQPSLGVDRPQQEIVLRQFALKEEASGLQIAGAGLGVRPVRFHVATDASPDVDVPRDVDRQDEIVRGALLGSERARQVLRRTRASVAGANRSGREELRARGQDERAGLPELALGDEEVLVRDAHLRLERIQQRIAEDLPPRPADHPVARLRGLPLGALRHLLVGAGRLDRRAHVVRPDRAAGRDEKGRADEEGDDRKAPYHAWVAWATARRARPRRSRCRASRRRSSSR